MPTPSPTASQTPTSPLAGTWDTGPIPTGQVRAAIIAGGYTTAEADDFLRGLGWSKASHLEFNLNFYTEGGVPFVVQTGWNPDAGPMPTDGDHGPYELLAGNEVAITSADPSINKYREVFSYSIAGDRLTLHVVGETNPDLTPEELRLDERLLLAMAAAPLMKND